ncbi:hypothetical protein SAMN05216184_1165 [Georgenia satyanarayanai]|uniref:Polyketide cyclase / dehydrase and lipid transport n=1 Tax=Georgenia satyanarayanai TaxID=860221 RepID=A0A2Y9AUY0_9MICO|nr:SRPBCC family protein [Georgenia satyanarayanai]PYF97221.1 hypothetical protein A8987_1165 [Georgenia satyanarayanai]SSA46307.1 hypothetical protein SAMN05216184_1165 [Georgenia satyanarayanai]
MAGRSVLRTAPLLVLALVLEVARRAKRDWGATRAEARTSLPGDDILGPAAVVATRAVTIGASPGDVWPWLAQLGQGRGGFYSYDRLQCALGLDIHNAEEIVPQWQDLAPGDPVHLAADVPLTAVVVEPGHALVLRAPEGPTGRQVVPGGFTWAFVLRPGPHGTTRLLVRERYVCPDVWSRLGVELLQVASFVMTARMLRGIQERAGGRPRWPVTS